MGLKGSSAVRSTYRLGGVFCVYEREVVIKTHLKDTSLKFAFLMRRFNLRW